MLGRSHFLLAGASYAALVAHPLETPIGTLTIPVLSDGHTAMGMSTFILSVIVAAACGLAPDLDKRGSKASRSLGPVTGTLSWGIEHTFGHRGAFHSLLGIVLGYVMGELLGNSTGFTGLGALVAFGWSIHLLTDAWTVQGVPLFWPISRRHVKLPPWFPTGTWKEAVMLVLTLLGLTAYAYGHWPAALS